MERTKSIIPLVLIGLLTFGFERIIHPLIFTGIGYTMGTAIWGVCAKSDTPGKINLNHHMVDLPLGGVGLGITLGAILSLIWNVARPEFDTIEMWLQIITLQIGIQLGLWF